MVRPKQKRAGPARWGMSVEISLAILLEVLFWLAVVLTALKVVGAWIFLVLLAVAGGVMLWREHRRPGSGA